MIYLLEQNGGTGYGNCRVPRGGTEFVESSMTIEEQIDEILRHSGDYIIFDTSSM